jgi:hypothetical protein
MHLEMGQHQITVDFAYVTLGIEKYESTTFRVAQRGYQAPASLYTRMPFAESLKKKIKEKP